MVKQAIYILAVVLMSITSQAEAGIAFPALRFKPWEKQLQFFHAVNFEIRLLAWANRTGKTTIAACEACLAGEGQHPYAKPGDLKGYPRPPFTIWAVSNSYKQMEDSFVPAFEGDATHPRTLPRGVTLNRQRMEYVLPSGSKIRLKTTEAGRESFQGAAVPLVLLDEDIDPGVLKEIFMRIGKGFRRRVVWTITAVNGLTYPYQYFYKPWLEYRAKGLWHPKIWYMQASTDENPHLDKDEIEETLKFFPPDSKEYKVRRYGGFENIAGDSVFPQNAIDKHSATCEPGELRELRWAGEGFDVQHRKARPNSVAMSVWKRPVIGARYAIGADVAEGKLSNLKDDDSDRDWSAACVLDRDRQEVVATLHCRVDPHTFALWLWMMGSWYNKAWICPELNHNGVAVLGVLRGSVMLPQARDLPTYPHIYARETHFDQYVEDISDDLLGWKTTTITRPKMISEFYTVFVEGPYTVYDAVLVDEAKSFQRNRQGKAEHSSGFHDDLLFAAMLATQADIQCPSGLGSLLASRAGDADDVPFDPSAIVGHAEISEWEHDYDDEVVV